MHDDSTPPPAIPMVEHLDCNPRCEGARHCFLAYAAKPAPLSQIEHFLSSYERKGLGRVARIERATEASPADQVDADDERILWCWTLGDFDRLTLADFTPFLVWWELPA